MPNPVLLVHDDVSQIAAVRRLLANEGCDVTLVTSADDAAVAFGNCHPRLVVLAPAVEGGRGKAALESLRQHPQWSDAKLLLLGGALEECDAPALGLPLDGAALLDAVHTLLGPDPAPPAAESESAQPAPPQESAAPAPYSPPEPATVVNFPPPAPVVRASDPTPEAESRFPLSGSVSQEQLGRLLAKLSAVASPLCLELRSSSGLRSLWLQRGRLVAATSGVEEESLLDRSRRDGLIDGKQESEIWLSGATSSVEVVRALVSKGYLRQSEVGPLVGRYVEQLARAAFKEVESAFRLAERFVPRNIATATTSFPVLQVFVDAIRQGRGVDFIWRSLGGRHTVPQQMEVMAQSLASAWSDEAWQLLASANGRDDIETLSAGMGLQPDVGASIFWLAKQLGIVRFNDSQQAVAAGLRELDVERLNAKAKEIELADYFQMLGLERSAGREEVQQAFAGLSSQFDPLKFAGHPDPKVLQTAHQVHSTLVEAAAALQDDELRQLYAKNLVDLA